jgi:hypothetical protein
MNLISRFLGTLTKIGLVLSNKLNPLGFRAEAFINKALDARGPGLQVTVKRFLGGAYIYPHRKDMDKYVFRLKVIPGTQGEFRTSVEEYVFCCNEDPQSPAGWRPLPRTSDERASLVDLVVLYSRAPVNLPLVDNR